MRFSRLCTVVVHQKDLMITLFMWSLHTQPKQARKYSSLATSRKKSHYQLSDCLFLFMYCVLTIEANLEQTFGELFFTGTNNKVTRKPLFRFPVPSPLLQIHTLCNIYLTRSSSFSLLRGNGSGSFPTVTLPQTHFSPATVVKVDFVLFPNRVGILLVLWASHHKKPRNNEKGATYYISLP